MLDQLYEKYAKETRDWDDLERKFVEVTDYIKSLDIDYDSYRVGGVSHLYGIWCLANKCVSESVPATKVKPTLVEFFEELRSSNIKDKNVDSYKKSMSSRTKNKSQRKRRLDALWEYISKKS